MFIILGHPWSNQNPLRFYLTPARIATIKNITNNNIGQDVGKRNPHTLLVGM
jgi:hypothetical protein